MYGDDIIIAKDEDKLNSRKVVVVKRTATDRGRIKILPPIEFGNKWNGSAK